MPTFRQSLTQRIRDAVAATGMAVPDGIAIEAMIASDSRFGDYQSNAAMMLAQAAKMNPRKVAESVAGAFDGGGLWEAPAIAGPGFLNFRLTREALAASVAAQLTDDKLGVPRAADPRRIVVDFSAPNVAKPMHVGHIRSTIIGDALARIARFLGHQSHHGQSHRRLGHAVRHDPPRLEDHARPGRARARPHPRTGRVYRDVNAATKADDAVLEHCKNELVKLQAGDAENLGIWQECVDLTLDQLHQLYDRLDIQFDHYLGESFYNDALAPLVEDLLARSIARKSDGAVCVFSDGAKPPEDDPFLINRGGEWVPAPCLIRKADGGFLYATTDLATIDHRIHEWKADEIWYVVGAPQQLHFRQVFEAAHRRGAGGAHGAHRLRLILGPDGKMFKTRSGESVGLLEVLDEAVERARAVVAERGAWRRTRRRGSRKSSASAP